MSIRKNKKALIGEPLIIFMAFMLIIIIIALFYMFTELNTKSVKDAEETLGNNVFLVSLLRTQLLFEGKNIALYELVSRYDFEGRTDEKIAIQSNISFLMKNMYQKNICWTLTIPDQDAITQEGDCDNVANDEKISALITIPGLNKKNYAVGFNT